MKSLSEIKNNKGMTLVEVIISVAIVSIVIGVIFSFMVTGSKIFTSSSSEIKMQQDAQLVLSNIENRILDAQLGAYFEQDDTSNPTFAKLTILNATGREYIYWVGTENKVYYDSDTIDITDLSAITTKDKAALTSSGTKEVLAENVKKFFVEFKDTKVREGDASRPKAYVSLDMKERDKNGTERGIESNKTVSFRNKISTAVPSEKQLYIDAKKEVVELMSVKVTPNNVTMIVPSAGGAGRSQKFSARVLGVGQPSQVVEWSIEGSPAGVSVDADGVVTVTEAATDSKITVVATAKVGNKVESGKTEVTLQKITGVTVTDSSPYYAGTFVKIAPGLSINQENVNDKFGKFTYTITPKSPGGSADDIIVYSADNGLVFLNSNTQGKTYTVRVTSAYDTSQYAEFDIKVENTSIVDSGSGSAVAIRGDKVELHTALSTTNLAENELNISWQITDDAGLGGKVSVNNKGEFSVAKDVNYEKDYEVEVKATVSATRLLNPITKLVKVKIPAVSLHFVSENGEIKKNSTETYKLEATGLVLAPEDVYVSTNPALSNCIVYPTKDGVQVSVGGGNKATSFDLIATLKNTNTSTSMKITIK